MNCEVSDCHSALLHGPYLLRGIGLRGGEDTLAERERRLRHLAVNGRVVGGEGREEAGRHTALLCTAHLALRLSLVWSSLTATRPVKRR